jgi:hypothetical protein
MGRYVKAVMTERDQVAREEQSQERLPGLRVIIRQNGETIKSVSLSDPRQEYIKAFNERCGPMGMAASLN